MFIKTFYQPGVSKLGSCRISLLAKVAIQIKFNKGEVKLSHKSFGKG